MSFVGERIRTLARASNPRLWPSTVSIRWFRANRRLPSITKATCCGMGPCRSAPMRSSRSCTIPHSTGGDCRSHFRSCERCMDGMVMAKGGQNYGYYGSRGLSAEGGPESFRLEIVAYAASCGRVSMRKLGSYDLCHGVQRHEIRLKATQQNGRIQASLSSQQLLRECFSASDVLLSYAPAYGKTSRLKLPRSPPKKTRQTHHRARVPSFTIPSRSADVFPTIAFEHHS